LALPRRSHRNIQSGDEPLTQLYRTATDDTNGAFDGVEHADAGRVGEGTPTASRRFFCSAGPEASILGSER
jgi:hypothetical protein